MLRHERSRARKKSRPHVHSSRVREETRSRHPSHWMTGDLFPIVTTLRVVAAISWLLGLPTMARWTLHLLDLYYHKWKERLSKSNNEQINYSRYLKFDSMIEHDIKQIFNSGHTKTSTHSVKNKLKAFNYFIMWVM